MIVKEDVQVDREREKGTGTVCPGGMETLVWYTV